MLESESIIPILRKSNLGKEGNNITICSQRYQREYGNIHSNKRKDFVNHKQSWFGKGLYGEKITRFHFVVLENANLRRISLVSHQITCAHRIYINLICDVVYRLPAGVLHPLFQQKLLSCVFVGRAGKRCSWSRKLLSKLFIGEELF